MHELSIAQAVAEVASRHAAGRRVRKVEVKMGHLRQVVPSALEFSVELVTEGTVLAGAGLVIEDVPACGCCRSCGTRTVMRAFPLQCSHCGGVDLELEAGEERLVDALVMSTRSIKILLEGTAIEQAGEGVGEGGGLQSTHRLLVAAIIARWVIIVSRRIPSSCSLTGSSPMTT